MELDVVRSRAGEVEHGFRPLLELATELVRDDPAALDTAEALWGCPDHQSRMLAVIIWGEVIAEHPHLLTRLRDEVSADPDWRVQELLARSFTAWCVATGWETAVPTIAEWLADERATVRRAATEGPRVWTNRPYFREHPEVAIRMLRARLDDPDDYARRSAENALRDVVKRFPALA